MTEASRRALCDRFRVGHALADGGVLVRRRELLIALGGAVLVLPRFATAQSRVAHIAVMVSRLPPQSPLPFWPAFVEALRERASGVGSPVTLSTTTGRPCVSTV